MKNILVLLAAVPLAFAHVVERAACNNDNCARAVTGTYKGDPRSASRVSTDCASFQQVTSYPVAVTVTVTSGSVATTIQPPVASTTVIPSVVPAYAQSACTPSASNSARFASACSCAGVTRTTAVVTPTATVVVPAPGPGACTNPVSGSQGVSGPCDATDESGGPFTGSTCYCFQTTNDGNLCIPNFYCGSALCSSDSDCAAGEVCTTDTFCFQNACAPGPGCVNNSSPSRLFRKRRSGATGAWAS